MNDKSTYSLVFSICLLTITSCAQSLNEDQLGQIVFSAIKNKSWSDIDKINKNPNSEFRDISKESFYAAIKEGEDEGIDWSKIELIEIEEDYGIEIGSNPTKYDTLLAMELKSKTSGFYLVIVFKYDGELYEFDAGFFEKTSSGLSLTSELYFQGEYEK